MDALTILVMLGALATVIVLLRGVGTMAEGGEFESIHSQQLMFARVAVQAITVLFILVALLAHLE